MKFVFAIMFSFSAVLSMAADGAGEIPPTFEEASYGPDKMNVLDFWQAKGDGPRPLMVYIHGGGWTAGDKKLTRTNNDPFLNRGVSFASINYRLAPKHPLPTPVHDAARAIQFLRFNAAKWKIDPTHIVLHGSSAGGCTAMWLLLHDDLADPNATDPVLRESTRVRAAAVDFAQSSIDPKVIDIWLGPAVLSHSMIYSAVGEKSMLAAMKHYDKHRPQYVEFSPWNHVDANDPPLFMTYRGEMTVPAKDAKFAIHHPVFGVKMKEKSDRVGHECHLLIDGHTKPQPYANAREFFLAKLLKP